MIWEQVQGYNLAVSKFSVVAKTIRKPGMASSVPNMQRAHRAPVVLHAAFVRLYVWAVVTRQASATVVQRRFGQINSETTGTVGRYYCLMRFSRSSGREEDVCSPGKMVPKGQTWERSAFVSRKRQLSMTYALLAQRPCSTSSDNFAKFRSSEVAVCPRLFAAATKTECAHAALSACVVLSDLYEPREDSLVRDSCANRGLGRKTKVCSIQRLVS